MRKTRILKAGAVYHVCARANRKEMIFDSPEIKELFLTVLREAKKKFGFELQNFCIMGNHYHLIIRPQFGRSLSDIMHWIMGVFAIRYNKLKHLCGHVWGARFFSRILATISEILNSFNYIDQNPVRAGLCDRPGQWRWCAFWHCLNHRSELVHGKSTIRMHINAQGGDSSEGIPCPDYLI